MIIICCNNGNINTLIQLKSELGLSAPYPEGVWVSLSTLPHIYFVNKRAGMGGLTVKNEGLFV